MVKHRIRIVKKVTTYSLQGIPDGREGTRATLKLMADISKRYKKNPTIFELSRCIVRNVPNKQWLMEAGAILKWVQRHIRYTMDIQGVETLQTPVQTLRLGQGDCDDHSMLIASLLMAINRPARFVAVGRMPNSFEHVFTQTKVGDKWVTLESTEENWPLGRTYSKIKSKMVWHL